MPRGAARGRTVPGVPACVSARAHGNAAPFHRHRRHHCESVAGSSRQGMCEIVMHSCIGIPYHFNTTARLSCSENLTVLLRTCAQVE